jgi:hypothetical protein
MSDVPTSPPPAGSGSSSGSSSGGGGGGGNSGEPYATDRSAIEPWLPSNVRAMLAEDPARNPDAWSRIEAVRRQGNEGKWELDAELRAFDAAGVLRTIQHFRANKGNGPMHTFYPSGSRKSSRSYRDGRPDGVFEQWFESGAIESRTEWANGKVVVSVYFYESGQPRSETRTDEQGRNHGYNVQWHENGSEMGRALWRDGKHLYKVEFSADGTLTSLELPINEGVLIVKHPKNAARQRIFMFEGDEDYELPITLPVSADPSSEQGNEPRSR